MMKAGDIVRIHAVREPSGVDGVFNMALYECELEEVHSSITTGGLVLLRTFRCKVCGAIYTEG